MKKFLLYAFAALGGIFAVLMLVLVFSVRSMVVPKTVAIANDTQLYINLDHQIKDFPTVYSFDIATAKKPTAWEVERALRHAANDGKITSAFLRVDFPSISWSQVYSILKAIEVFKSSGKKINCYASSFGSLGGGLKTYVLARACSSITLQPLGEVAVSPISEKDVYGGEFLFFKGFFDKWKITADFVTKGKYKSAPEPLILKGFSDNNRASIQSLITSYEKNILELLNAGEANLPADFLTSGPYTDTEALNLKLVSNVSHSKLSAKKRVSVIDYYTHIQQTATKHPKTIVVVPLGGSIVNKSASNNMQDGSIAPSYVADLVQSLKKRSDVQAVVFSINSPGGSALASERIAYWVNLLKKDKKVVVHMRSAAASGGYYIASPADYIFATPFTLTGSIGVFVGKFVLGDALKDAGVSFEAVNTKFDGDILSALRTFSDKQRAYIMRSMDRTYDQFVARVAAGRNLKKSDVLAAAEGRVWSGSQAKDLKLVDAIGTLQDALNKASELSGNTQQYNVEVYKAPRGFSALLLELLDGMQSMQVLVKGVAYLSETIFGGAVTYNWLNT